MPNWKKVVVSGSAANLSSLHVDTSVTASIFSGSSFIGNLTGTASYATTASYVNPLVQTVQITGSFNVSGSTTQVGNNSLFGNTTLSGSITISGSHLLTDPSIKLYGDVETNGAIKFLPVVDTIDPAISGSYIYVSGSTNDLYFSQNGNGFANTTRLRWLEGNLYTGLLNGGVISIVTGSTTFNISSGSGLIVNLNASLTDNPYPTVQYLNWNNFTSQSLTYLTSSIQTFLGIGPNGQIIQQTQPWTDGQYNTSLSIGTVLHQNQATVNASITYPNVAYGYKQRTYDFIKAFGPLKLTGLPIYTSSSLGLTVGSGTAWADGRNYQVDPNNPSYINDPGTTVSKIFRYYQSGSSFVQDTNGGAGFTVIDPANYNPNGSGSLTPVPGTGANRQWSIQRVFWYPNSATKGIVVYYGTATYLTESDAAANLSYEQFQETPNTQQNAVYLGAVIVRNDATFTNAATFRILPGGIFRSVGGSGGGGGSAITQTLTGLSDVNIVGPTNLQPFAYDTVQLKWVNTSIISASIVGNAATATSASYASTSSWALNTINAQTASYVTLAQTASYVLNAVSASEATLAQTASYALQAVSSSYALTASYALNGGSGGGGATTGSNVFEGDQTISGSLTVTGSIAGNVLLMPQTASNVVVSTGYNGMLISPVQLQGSSSVAIGSNLIIL